MIATATHTATTRRRFGLGGAVWHRLGVIRPDFYRLPDDPDGQVRHTIAYMTAFACADAASPQVQEIVRLGGILARAESATAANIHRWVRTHCTFVEDADGVAPLETAGGDQVVELLLRPTAMLHYRAGDCDDFACLVACLCVAAGINAAYATVAADRSQPGAFSHVYAVAYPRGGGRMALDASHGPHAGWEVQPVFRRAEWPIPSMRSQRCA